MQPLLLLRTFCSKLFNEFATNKFLHHPKVSRTAAFLALQQTKLLPHPLHYSISRKLIHLFDIVALKLTLVLKNKIRSGTQDYFDNLVKTWGKHLIKALT